nr:putative capsid [Marmot picobirnavirus]
MNKNKAMAKELRADFKDAKKASQGRNQSRSKRSRTNRDRKNAAQQAGDSQQNKFDATVAQFNDPEWYASNPELLRDSASLSFNAATGAPIDLGLNNTIGSSIVQPAFGYKFWTLADGASSPKRIALNEQTMQSSPGVMALELVLTPGPSSDYYSPLNVAARNIYTTIRQANSGAKNYESADLMMYLLAMDQCFAAFNWMKRAYGLINKYYQLNRYYPDALIRANHIDPIDMRSNLADFRYFINVVAAKLSAFCVPAHMKYFIRHSWLMSNVYKEGESDKSQMYEFVPAGFYRFNETFSSADPGELEWESFTVTSGTAYSKILSVNEIKDLINQLLTGIISSEDCAVISGDIRKAYGESVFTLSPVDETYIVEPVYNEEVLSQIHNAVATGAISSNSSIRQENGQIIFTPSLAPFPDGFKLLLDARGDHTEPADVMVMTRLANYVKSTSVSGAASETAFGSEMLTDFVLYAMVGGGSSVIYPPQVAFRKFRTYNRILNNVFDAQTISQTAYGQAITTVKLIAELEKFNFAPIIYYSFGVASNTGADPSWILPIIAGDLENYVTITYEEVDRMHQTALLSLFGVPFRQ